ncbi:hypothetical protein [Amycolatopsis benzoatilytica]|uniref:hypothetical protein n=1 Tax=Amycolatopsis benzoatilytica TaxID=346045 RepID=UPI0003721A3A|nr:hypothetical protein [Amycolatopsis benzoatilytica]
MPSRPQSTAAPSKRDSGKPEPRGKPDSPAPPPDAGEAQTPAALAGTKRVLWWGGLAALATVGILEWPVAAAVGAGSYVAEKLAAADARADRAAEN